LFRNIELESSKNQLPISFEAYKDVCQFSRGDRRSSSVAHLLRYNYINLLTNTQKRKDTMIKNSINFSIIDANSQVKLFLSFREYSACFFSLEPLYLN
jgi:hypothetical protein